MHYLFKDFQRNLYYFVLFSTLLEHILCIHSDCLTYLSLLYVDIKENYVRSEAFRVNDPGDGDRAGIYRNIDVSA